MVSGPMRIFISVDMEGVAGVVDETHWVLGQPNYPRACDLMVGEANAAIEGAVEAGATEIVVNDSHHFGINLDAAKLHPAAKLVSGRIRPLSMCQGLCEGLDAAMFIGYHAGRGALHACLDHTYTAALHEVRLNGRPVNEAHINGLVAGHFGVPLVLVSGDQVLREEMLAWNDQIVCTVVKESMGRQAVKSVHPTVAREMIQRDAARALGMAREMPALTLIPPLTLEITLENPQMGDILERVVAVERTAAREVRVEADDMLTLFRHFLTIMTMAGTVR